MHSVRLFGPRQGSTESFTTWPKEPENPTKRSKFRLQQPKQLRYERTRAGSSLSRAEAGFGKDTASADFSVTFVLNLSLKKRHMRTPLLPSFPSSFQGALYCCMYRAVPSGAESRGVLISPAAQQLDSSVCQSVCLTMHLEREARLQCNCVLFTG